MPKSEAELIRLLETEQRARAAAEASLQQLRTVQDILDATLVHRSTTNLVRELLARIKMVLAVDNVAILIPSDDGLQLVVHSAHGPEAAIADQVRVPIGQGIAGKIAASREPRIVEDLRAVEVANPFLKQTIRSLMGVPLVAEDRLVGVLHVGMAAARRFTDDDLLLLRLIAFRIGVVLDQARLYDEEQRLRNEAASRADELEAERDRLQQIIDVLPEGIMIATANPPILTTMNRVAQELLGVNLIGLPVPIPPPGPEGEFAARRPDGTPYPLEELPLERALLRGEIVRGDQLLIRHATEGREITLLANSAPLRDARGGVAGAVEVFQDISALKDLELQRDEFLATVSHDLKNPLTSILGMSQLLQRRLGHIEERERTRLAEGLGVIIQTAQQMAAQINELLDVTRAQMSRPLPIEREPTDVIALLERVADEYQRTTDRHTLRIECREGKLIAMVDPARLHRAIANIMANAVKYSPHGGDILTTVVCIEDQDEAWIDITVTDQGVGIPGEAIEHIFKGYYRAGNVAGRFSGTGLGLTGVKRVIEGHGGTVTLESAEGIGTAVTIRIPWRRPQITSTNGSM